MKKTMMYLFLFCSLFCLCNLVAIADFDSGKTSFSSKEVEMRTSTRMFFADYLNWQRIFAVETLTGSQDVDKAQLRLQKSQDNINGIFKTYYGDGTGTQVGDLFNQYLGLIVDYANTTRSHGDKTMVINKIHDKIDDIAELLNVVNMNWTSNDLSNMFKEYSDSFLSEIDLQDKSMGSIDTNIFDTTFDKSMQMADTFSSGIIKQYPGKFW